MFDRKQSATIRPVFSNRMKVKEFKECSWYKMQLETICKQCNLPYDGSKQELTQRIVEYLSMCKSAQDDA